MKKQNVTYGTIYLMFSQLTFVASGYAIHIGLARLFGPSEYGIYAVVISIMGMINLILTTGIPPAVSKYVAHDDGNAENIKKTALKLQFIFSLVIFLLFFLLAKRIALLLNDVTLTPYLRISAFIVPTYSIYSLLVGYLNGLREYKKQAITTISYSIFKALFILLMVIANYGVMGAIIGFVFAPLTGLLIAIYFTRKKSKVLSVHDTLNLIPVKQIINYAVPIMFFSVATNFIMSIDLFFVKSYLTNYETGIYSAASMISRVPFFLISGLFGALFPAISNSTANNNIKQTHKYIINSLKYSLAALVPVVLIISYMSDDLISLVYSNEYSGATDVLTILAFGLGFYSIFILFTTILNGSGRPKDSLIISVVVLGIDVLLNFVLVPRYEMIGAAISTTGACFLGAIGAGILVYSSQKSV